MRSVHLLSASLLFKLGILISSGVFVQSCVKTATTPPGSITPPCGLCTTNSYYVTDRCDDENGCAVFPPSQVITQTTTAGGCKEATMVCPEGSRVTFAVGGVMETTTVSWTEFVELFGGFMNILCSDESMWYINFANGAILLESIYCYNIRCPLCEDLLPPTEAQCPDTNCRPPIITYTPPTPIPGENCRQIEIDCLSVVPPPNFPDLSGVKFVFSNGMEQSFTPEQFNNREAGTLSCNNESVWILTSPAPELRSRPITTITCQYS